MPRAGVHIGAQSGADIAPRECYLTIEERTRHMWTLYYAYRAALPALARQAAYDYAMAALINMCREEYYA